MIQERILLLMKARGMNPTQFADEIGVQRSSISHILSGRNNPSLDIITKILNRFSDVDSNWLVLGKGSLVAKSAQESMVEKNIEFSKPSETKISEFSDSLFDDIQEEKPLNLSNNNIEDLKRKIELLEHSASFEKEELKPINDNNSFVNSNHIVETIKTNNENINSFKEVNPIIQSNNQINVSKEMEPLNPVLSSNQNANNIELTVNQNKSEDKIRVTKIMIFYSDSTFEEFTKN